MGWLMLSTLEICRGREGAWQFLCGFLFVLYCVCYHVSTFFKVVSLAVIAIFQCGIFYEHGDGKYTGGEFAYFSTFAFSSAYAVIES